MANPKLEEKKMAMWFDEDLLQVTGVKDTFKNLQRKNIKVNHPLEEVDSLVLFVNQVEKRWQVTLTDSSTISLYNCKEILNKANFIVFIGAQIPADLHLGKGAIMEMDSFPQNQLAEVVEEIGMIMENNIGKKSLEEALRDWAKQKLGEQKNIVELMNKVTGSSAVQRLIRNIESSHSKV